MKWNPLNDKKQLSHRLYPIVRCEQQSEVHFIGQLLFSLQQGIKHNRGAP